MINPANTKGFLFLMSLPHKEAGGLLRPVKFTPPTLKEDKEFESMYGYAHSISSTFILDKPLMSKPQVRGACTVSGVFILLCIRKESKLD